MAAFLVISLVAAQLGATPAPSSGVAAMPRVSASAQASVRILPGAKVNLAGAAQADGYRLTDATITTEDGNRRPAKLVEFQ